MDIKKILCGLTAALMLTGCSDSFLDTDNLTNKDSSNFPKNVSDANEIITGIYRPMMGDADVPYANPLFVAELMSDERLGAAGKDDPPSQAVANYSKVDENMYSNFWGRMYQGIYRCNYMIASDPIIYWAGDETTRGRILGETYFMRAFYYFDLVKFFERVPMPLTPDPANLPQAEPDEAYAQIASDLLKAIELLPPVKHAGMNGVGTDGHATRWAAEALLARVYLFYSGVYGKDAIALPGDEGSLSKTEVIAHLEDCMNNSGHRLADNFGELWPYSAAGDYWLNKKYGWSWLGDNTGWAGWEGQTAGYRENPEFIFVGKHAYGEQYYGRNLTALFFGMRYQSAAYNDNAEDPDDFWGGTYPFGQGWGGGTITPDIWNTWDDNDLRKKASILNVDDPEEVLPDGRHMTYHDNGFHQVEDTHMFNKKYIAINVHCDLSKISETGANRDAANGIADGLPLYWYCVPDILNKTDNDYMSCNFMDDIWIRYADVLLMHSELTGTADGINKVRARVGLDPVGYSLDNLIAERRHELAFEGLRFFDLKRWGKLDLIDAHRTNIKAYCDGELRTINVRMRPETKGWLPIPADEIAKSEGVLTQNPGWASNEGNFSGQY